MSSERTACGTVCGSDFIITLLESVFQEIPKEVRSRISLCWTAWFAELLPIIMQAFASDYVIDFKYRSNAVALELSINPQSISPLPSHWANSTPTISSALSSPSSPSRSR